MWKYMKKANFDKEFPLGRFTYNDEYGNACIVGVDMSFMMNLSFNEMVIMSEALNRLSAYEDTLDVEVVEEK